jgi:hypothetical protein
MSLLVQDIAFDSSDNSPEGFHRLFKDAIDVDVELRGEDLQRQGKETMFLPSKLSLAAHRFPSRCGLKASTRCLVPQFPLAELSPPSTPLFPTCPADFAPVHNQCDETQLTPWSLKKANGLSLLNITCSWIPFNLSEPMDEEHAADAKQLLDVGEELRLIEGLYACESDARDDICKAAVGLVAQASSAADEDKDDMLSDPLLDVGVLRKIDSLPETTDDVSDIVRKGVIRIVKGVANVVGEGDRNDAIGEPEGSDTNLVQFPLLFKTFL